jgi:hypothetical protein
VVLTLIVALIGTVGTGLGLKVTVELGGSPLLLKVTGGLVNRDETATL